MPNTVVILRRTQFAEESQLQISLRTKYAAHNCSYASPHFNLLRKIS